MQSVYFTYLEKSLLISVISDKFDARKMKCQLSGKFSRVPGRHRFPVIVLHKKASYKLVQNSVNKDLDLKIRENIGSGKDSDPENALELEYIESKLVRRKGPDPDLKFLI